MICKMSHGDLRIIDGLQLSRNDNDLVILMQPSDVWYLFLEKLNQFGAKFYLKLVFYWPDDRGTIIKTLHHKSKQLDSYPSNP